MRGVDQDNYFRTIYGPQPVANGLITKRQLLTYIAGTGLVASLFDLYLIAINAWDPLIWILLGLGAFFVLFYTWPLKYIALGEIAGLLVWGPLMIGGGYYVLAYNWDWNVIWASVHYVLGVTTVIFGKHIEVMLIVFLAIPSLRQVFPAFLKPRPAPRVSRMGREVGRSFGGLFMLGQLIDVILRILPATANF